MKNIIKIIIILIASIFIYLNTFANWAIDFSSITWWDNISNKSINVSWGSIEEWVNKMALWIFKTIKVILGWLFVIMIVYAWAMMILSMWSNEEQLSSAKRSIRIAVLWLMFINIPGSLYLAFTWKKTSDDVTSDIWWWTSIYDRNIFMNSWEFWSVVWNLVAFLQFLIVGLAILVIILQWIKIISAWWESEKINEAKNKILYSLGWLIFVWIMEVWRNLMFKWDFSDTWVNLFWSLANLALFFAGPIAIFFLTLAWYYYITSNGEEEKTKKAKNIVINTLLATLILLWMFTFFKDLEDLRF